MVFRRDGRPGWYTWPTLPGFGRVGPYVTGARQKRLAEAVEAWLREKALSDPEVVRGILGKHYTLREAYVADKEGRLDALKLRATDPPLSKAIGRYAAGQTDRRKRNGLEQLAELAPRGARLSWLADARNITGLLVEARAQGRRTNSVHRSLYAAIKGLLAFEYGEAQKRAITADVQFAYEDDTRHVDVTPEQVRQLLAACDPQVYDLAVAAMLTGIDRGPLLRMTTQHYDPERSILSVPDTKTRARRRVLELSEAADLHFRLIVSRTESGGRLFPLSEGQITKRWQAVKKDTDLDVRFKDLRHVFANAWVDEGGTLNDLSKVLGHTRATTTLKYTARQVREARDRMDRVADRLGLRKPHIRVETA